MTLRAWKPGPEHEIVGVPEDPIQRLAHFEIPIGQTASDHQLQQTPVAQERVSPGPAAKSVTDQCTNEGVNRGIHPFGLGLLGLSCPGGSEATALRLRAECSSKSSFISPGDGFFNALIRDEPHDRNHHV